MRVSQQQLAAATAAARAREREKERSRSSVVKKAGQPGPCTAAAAVSWLFLCTGISEIN